MTKENVIYTNSILTYAFTNDGQIIVRRDKEGKMDTLPWLFVGYHEKGSKIDYEDSIWIINNTEEYQEKIAIFFAYHLKRARKAILEGFLVGNHNYLLDVGELHDKIAPYQVGEMKTLEFPTYIRINKEFYNIGTNQARQQIINNVETRYIVLPTDNIQEFPNLEAKDIESLKNDFNQLSNKLILGTTGKDGQIMEEFINQLKFFNEDVPDKKK